MNESPCTWNDLKATDERAYSPLEQDRLNSEAKLFYRSALKQSRLCTLLTLSSGSGHEKLDYHNIETNKLLSATFKNGNDPQVGVIPQEALFVLVQCLESVTFLMHLLQITRICKGLGYHPQPMDHKAHYRLSRKFEDGHRQLVIMKQRLIQDIAAGMEAAGCRYLATMWYLHYSVVGYRIRNSISHSTYLSPESEADSKWVFDELYLDESMNLKCLSLQMTRSEFERYFKNIIMIRMALLDAYRYVEGKISGREMVLRIQHPLFDNEFIDCEYAKRKIKLTNFKKPLWPRRTDI